MKYIISEEQLKTTIKRFNRERANKGELSQVIEELVLNYFEYPICDVIAIKIPNSEEYVVLILTTQSIRNEVSFKISRYIENYIGINPMVIIQDSQDC